MLGHELLGRQIEELPPARQKTLLQMVDAYLRDSKRA